MVTGQWRDLIINSTNPSDVSTVSQSAANTAANYIPLWVCSPHSQALVPAMNTTTSLDLVYHWCVWESALGTNFAMALRMVLTKSDL